MNDRPRITIDEVELRRRLDVAREAAGWEHAAGWGPIMLPTIDPESDSKIASKFTELVDRFIAWDVIRVPKGYRLSILNDDEEDITGIIVSVEVVGAGWPYISDGWSDIDNYLPRREDIGDDVDNGVEWDEFKALKDAIASVVGRADRCMAFAHNVRSAVELIDDVATGNTEFVRLEERARVLLSRRVLAR